MVLLPIKVELDTYLITYMVLKPLFKSFSIRYHGMDVTSGYWLLLEWLVLYAL